MAEEKRVLVIGDVMLDHYIYGTVDRISPEAPIPIHLNSRSEYFAGGAANVAIILSNHGVLVDLVGVVGCDEAGDRLGRICDDQNVRQSFIYDKSKPTITKVRFIASNRQVFRHDREDPFEGSLLETKLANMKYDENFDAIIVSDYGKGSFNNLETHLKYLQRLPKIFVDPAQKDFRQYAGAFLIKPNKAELTRQLVQFEGLNKIYNLEHLDFQTLLHKWDIENLLVTCGAEGALLATNAGEVIKFKAPKVEAIDVTGAGDVFLAMLVNEYCRSGTSLANSIKKAVSFASESVSGFGNRLALQLDGQGHKPSNSEPGADQETKVFGFTNGCFDIVHTGHLELLRHAAANCDYLIVGLNSDASVKRLKGKERPINNEIQRKKFLEALPWVDEVIIFEEDTPLELIKKLRPNYLIKGNDYRREKIIGAQIVLDYNGKVERFPITNNISSTDIITRIKNIEEI